MPTNFPNIYGAVGSSYVATSPGASVTVANTVSWASASSTFSIANTYQPTVKASEYDLTIVRNGKELKVAETIETILERLCVLVPIMEKHEKYPALKEAYDNYKLVEAMLTGEDKNE